MRYIELISRVSGARRWEHELASRLREVGYTLSISILDLPEENGSSLDGALVLTKRGVSLADRARPLCPTAGRQPDLIVDFTGLASVSGAAVMRPYLCGSSSIPDGLAAMLANDLDAELIVTLDGRSVAHAAPMVEDGVWLGRMANTVLGALVTLIVATAGAFFDRRLAPTGAPPSLGKRFSLAAAYLPVFANGLANRAMRKVTGASAFPWKVGYRLIEGAGVAETGRLGGRPFSILTDDGKRFYADPFVIENQRRHFLFVEEYPYASAKGVISVAELDGNGRFGTPRVVLEEPHHLSYPQVFEHKGEMYMLPEASAADELVLYRGEQFPGGWRRHAVLLEGVNINDATLLVRDGAFWLIGTSRIGRGSPSDTMVVYGAPELCGPWNPHPLNPILIDRSAARPGGSFVRSGDRLLMPVQDGTRTYGGGLGLVELLRLTDREVAWGPVQPIAQGPALGRRGIHTLNRAGRVEVVDSVG